MNSRMLLLLPSLAILPAMATPRVKASPHAGVRLPNQVEVRDRGVVGGHSTDTGLKLTLHKNGPTKGFFELSGVATGKTKSGEQSSLMATNFLPNGRMRSGDIPRVSPGMDSRSVVTELSKQGLGKVVSTEGRALLDPFSEPPAKPAVRHSPFFAKSSAIRGLNQPKQ